MTSWRLIKLFFLLIFVFIVIFTGRFLCEKPDGYDKSLFEIIQEKGDIK